MANSKKTDLKAYSNDQLQSEVAELSSAISKLKFDHAIRGLANPLEIRETRKKIAKLNTEIRSRELSSASPEALANRSRIRLRRRLK